MINFRRGYPFGFLHGHYLMVYTVPFHIVYSEGSAYEWESWGKIQGGKEETEIFTGKFI